VFGIETALLHPDPYFVGRSITEFLFHGQTVAQN
jgi:hypothetical protein